MKSLFDENFKYTKEASNLEAEFYKAGVDTLFSKYVELGYSPREIFYILSQSLNDMSLNELLGFPSNNTKLKE